MSTTATTTGKPLSVARLVRAQVAYVISPKRQPSSTARPSEPFSRAGHTTNSRMPAMDIR
jgi:hypothetical protein